MVTDDLPRGSHLTIAPYSVGGRVMVCDAVTVGLDARSRYADEQPGTVRLLVHLDLPVHHMQKSTIESKQTTRDSKSAVRMERSAAVKAPSMYKIEITETGVEPTKITTVLCVVIMLPNVWIPITTAEDEGGSR